MARKIGKPTVLGDNEDIEELLTENKAGEEKNGKKKADGFAEEPDVDPGIDYMRWSD